MTSGLKGSLIICSTPRGMHINFQTVFTFILNVYFIIITWLVLYSGGHNYVLNIHFSVRDGISYGYTPFLKIWESPFSGFICSLKSSLKFASAFFIFSKLHVSTTCFARSSVHSTPINVASLFTLSTG